MSIICQTKWLNPVIFNNSDMPHNIVQFNTLHDSDGIITIKIFEVKVVCTICPRGLLSRQYGNYLPK